MSALVLVSVVAGAGTSASADVLCKKKSGVTVIRTTSCKAKETQVDLTTLGAGPKGFAKVNIDGTVDATQSKNITNANVTLQGISAFCFHGLPFTPTHAVATVAYGSASNGSFGGEILQVEINPAGTTDCGADTVEVATGEYTGAPLAFDFAPAAFYIVFN